jgi:hypothetical protein
MEGLIGQPVTIDSPMTRPRKQERLINRWLAFLFFILLGTVAFIYLAAAALSM